MGGVGVKVTTGAASALGLASLAAIVPAVLYAEPEAIIARTKPNGDQRSVPDDLRNPQRVASDEVAIRSRSVVMGFRKPGRVCAALLRSVDSSGGSAKIDQAEVVPNPIGDELHIGMYRADGDYLCWLLVGR